MCSNVADFEYIIIIFISIIKKQQEYNTHIKYKQDGGGITEGLKSEGGFYHLYKD